MVFNGKNEFQTFYSNYAREEGFSVNVRSSNMGDYAGGYNNLTFGEKDCRNYLDKAKRLRLGTGDTEAIHNYFVKMQGRNSNFFYVMDLDEEGQL